MFSFKYIKYEKLAKLGWCMKVEKNNPEVLVHLGEYVETNNDWFVSGVWDGDFSKADFENANFLCATAVKKFEKGLTVYSPTHERQRFCYIKYEDSVLFSNSIPLLLAVSGESLDIDCDQYEKIFCAILAGTKDYNREIPLSEGKLMYQIFCADITIDDTLNMTYTRKTKHRDFEDFDDYYNTLIDVCKRIKENGEDPNRKHKFTLATTASSGYDSSTCAAIAKKVGCDTLMTFSGGYYDEDSAVDIGKQLGYTNIIERNYNDFKTKQNCIDAEYMINGDIGVYLQFSALICLHNYFLKNIFNIHIIEYK